MEPIFITSRSKVIMFVACTEKTIYNYDPQFPDSHAKPFVFVIKDNHVYVLHHDLKSLEQKHWRRRAHTSLCV
jgi:hypothetical protein